ncbi:MAG TPA: acylphosphatase [Candidatus Paceibacterota bacterium]|nr:acylphosphatase [Candidatus Paceibacterota bacterium]
MESLYCRIYGRVQLVMFRDFATRKAHQFGIVGYVRNMPDGSVEAYGEGKRKALEQWLINLKHGPLLSHVKRVDAQWNIAPPSDIPQKSFDSFDIIF